MSVIAAKKAQQKKGPESILVVMGITALIGTILNILIVWIFGIEINHTSVAPAIYFLVLAGISLGIASFIRENDDYSRFNDWIGAFVFVGIIIAIVLASYMW